jgi:hypothetical protein
MLIKTVCDGCIFQHQPNCVLGKETIEIDNHQYTKGFCGHRRDDRWFDKLNKEDPNFSASSAYDYVEGEHKTLSVVINHLEPNMLCDLEETIDSLDGNRINQVIVATQNQTKDGQKLILTMLGRFGNWALDHIENEHTLPYLSLTNYAFKRVKSLWFFPIVSGDVLDKDCIEQFYEYIGDYKRNYIGFYLDEDEPIRNIIHSGAFTIMGGHEEKPWSQKVKEFANWQEVYKKID